ncbi:MAG: riboflavin synthase [Desulfuromonas sp.]|uniref:riboflavin synthase n=1 Tax=Desulfuromonas sp. TaxID=892 RepID=UPI000CC8A318|nr:riboflavin synthase [Desulfuromonas sp.]PLX81903.1 MAG: riboflavin synthase [Desulfuromonas sp.]
MFTGLIEDLGVLREVRKQGERGSLVVSANIPASEFRLGESIAVNGVCLTVSSFGEGNFTADVSPETLLRTTLGGLPPCIPVNLERAVRLCDRLGGHLVTGHVDGVARILKREKDRNAVRFSISLPGDLARYVVEKGSIAVDGISLTVNRVFPENFSVSIIPHTLAETALKEKGAGDKVNLETDILGKYVERLLTGGTASAGAGIDLDFLAKHGFM